MDSILTSIKKLLGLPEDYEHFDTDIVIHINSVFMILKQLGVGPAEGFQIYDKLSVWSDFYTGQEDMSAVRTYVLLKVRLIFDPPTSSAVLTSIEKLISELEWRLNVAAESSMQGGENQNG